MRWELGVGRDLLAELGYHRPPWQADAVCRERPDVDFHAKSRAGISAALQVCGACLVRAECLTWALEDPTLLGVLGGTDDQARRLIRKRRTDATA